MHRGGRRSARHSPHRVAVAGLAVLTVLVTAGTWALPAAASAGPKSAGRALAPSDTVSTVPDLTGSVMVLTLDAATVAVLTNLGVAVAPEGAATAVAGGAGVSFPITSGYAEVHSNRSFKPGYVLGSIEAYGSGLTLSVNATSVVVTDLVVDLGESMVYATVGTTEDVPLFSIAPTGLQVARSGGALQVGGATVEFTRTGAAELDALFRTTAITAAMAVGTAQITAAGPAGHYTYTATGTTEIPRLSGISTSVTFGSAAAHLLERVGATPGADGSATYSSASRKISFPITGGTAVVHADRRGQTGYLEGVILHQGSGLTLTRGSTSVSLTDLTIEPGLSTIDGSVNGGADDTALFSIGSSKMRITTAGGNLHVNGAALDLTSASAALLDTTFATTDLVAGTAIGTLAMVASGR